MSMISLSTKRPLVDLNQLLRLIGRCFLQAFHQNCFLVSETCSISTKPNDHDPFPERVSRVVCFHTSENRISLASVLGSPTTVVQLRFFFVGISTHTYSPEISLPTSLYPELSHPSRIRLLPVLFLAMMLNLLSKFSLSVRKRPSVELLPHTAHTEA